MTNLDITGYSAWATLRQEEILADARRAQAGAAAETFGRIFKGLARWTANTVRAIREGLEDARQLAELTQLSDRQLSDMGLKRSDIPGYVANGAVAADGGAVSLPNLKPWKPEARASNDWAGRDTAAA